MVRIKWGAAGSPDKPKPRRREIKGVNGGETRRRNTQKQRTRPKRRKAGMGGDMQRDRREEDGKL